MKASLYSRIAAVLLLFFAFGHTLGFRQSDTFVLLSHSLHFAPLPRFPGPCALLPRESQRLHIPEPWGCKNALPRSIETERQGQPLVPFYNNLHSP